MLQHLTIKNYALIQSLEIQPSKNLNMITGETGAGKSIMLGAIGLLMGNRADTKVLFIEDEKCVIEGHFDLQGYDLKSLFEEENLDYENISIIRREIAPGGKSRAFINDTPVNLESLKNIGQFLMDIHSQHDTLQLGSNEYQLGLIDAYAQSTEEKNTYLARFKAFQAAKKAWEELKLQSENLKKEEDYHVFLYEELKKLQLKADEQEELEESLKELENAEEIKLKLHQSFVLLDQQDFNVLSQLTEIRQQLSGLVKISEKYESLFNRVESSLIELKDLAGEIESLNESTELDPEKLALTQERLSQIYHLQTKHQVQDISGLLAIQADLEEKVQKTANLEEELGKLASAKQSAEESMLKAAHILTQKRQKAAIPLCESICEIVKELGIPDAQLVCDIQEKAPGTDGKDNISFLFTANKGVKPQELKAVASGGEFSRLMFAVKYVLADKTALPTIIFDEIDTGVSGEIALRLVTRMKEMSQKHQVIAISHLPQFAAKGDRHYFVYKDNSQQKTISKMRELTAQEREIAIAQMIGGENHTEAALQSARELLMN
jgi:DNA repair protein RecN (Recombination protein N)